MRSAVHIKTTGFYCGACPRVVENAIGTMPGVLDVVTVRSMGLTSVLYDPDLTDSEILCARIRSAGFGAEAYCGRHDQESQDAATQCPLGRD